MVMGQLPELLARLKANGYEGVLSLEPHLLGSEAFERILRR